jgi:hypothetical protein
LDGYFYIPYDYLIEKRLINYLDGLWAITDIIPRTNHKPTVRRLVVPGHEHDEKRRRDHKRNQMNQLQTMMMMMNSPSQQQFLPYQRSIPAIKHTNDYFWYHKGLE